MPWCDLSDEAAEAAFVSPDLGLTASAAGDSDCSTQSVSGCVPNRVLVNRVLVKRSALYREYVAI